MSLISTIAILSGTPSAYAVDFSPLTFTNLSGTVTPINTRDVSLMRSAFAVCASFPCTATSGFQDGNPAVFSSTYTTTPASVPEPGYTLLMPTLLTVIVFGRRLVRPARTQFCAVGMQLADSYWSLAVDYQFGNPAHSQIASLALSFQRSPTYR